MHQGLGMSTHETENVAEPTVEHEHSTATKFDVDQIITELLL